MSGALAYAADLLDPPYAGDPVGWIERRLGESTWSAQREIMEALRDHRRTAVHSAYLTGKSWTAARVVGWWVDQHLPGDAFAITTAPTGDQVRAILWREIRRAHARGHLRGRVLQTEWKNRTGLSAKSDELVAIGRKPNDYDPTAMQGIHERYVLAVLDEASGIPEPLWEAVDGLTGNEDSRILAIGNPDDEGSYFARVCRPGSGWHVIHVDGLSTPNFTDEVVADRLHRVLLSPSWVQEKREEWGEDSPMFLSRVRGMFPDASDPRTVVRLGWARRCQREGAWGYADGAVPTEPVELGVDVGAGGDETVIVLRRGARYAVYARDRSSDATVVTQACVAALQSTGARRLKIDDIGWGWGVRDRLRELRGEAHEAEVVGVNVGVASQDPRRWYNLRSELWWMARELTRTGSWDLSAVSDDDLGSLVAVRSIADSANRFRVELKDETKRRLGHSPDVPDALILAAYEPPSVAFVAGAVHHAGRRTLGTGRRRDGRNVDPRGEPAG